eukprot:7704427-Heterocapsa_arctica.AAC.1
MKRAASTLCTASRPSSSTRRLALRTPATVDRGSGPATQHASFAGASAPHSRCSSRPSTSCRR